MTVSGGEEEDALNLDLELRSTVGRGDEQKGENRKNKNKFWARARTRSKTMIRIFSFQKPESEFIFAELVFHFPLLFFFIV